MEVSVGEQIMHTRSPMEPDEFICIGAPCVSLCYTRHTPRLHPDPEFSGAPWCFILPRNPYAQTAPRPRALWSSMGTFCGDTNKPPRLHPDPGFYGAPCYGPPWVSFSLIKTTPRPHPSSEPYGTQWCFVWPRKPCTQTRPRP